MLLYCNTLIYMRLHRKQRYNTFLPEIHNPLNTGNYKIKYLCKIIRRFLIYIYITILLLLLLLCSTLIFSALQAILNVTLIC